MANKNILTEEDDDLLALLGVEPEKQKHKTFSPREERLIVAFEEIQQFVNTHFRLPAHGEDKDIFERIYAVRLDQLRKHKEFLRLLSDFDHQNLLSEEYKGKADILDNIEDDELLAELGVGLNDANSITDLKHVRSGAQKKAADEIANRTRCDDFEHFRPLFELINRDIEKGYKQTIQFRKESGFSKTTIHKNQFVIIGGQLAYIAEIGEMFKAPNGDDDARLRVIYANGTESNILLRSLIRAMYKDETSRFISDSDHGPLFSGQSSEGDLESGTIYVLRSLSDHPLIKENRDVVHKIGVTGNEVQKRIANAKIDPTFLMADVEIVATYKLANINRAKLENVIHRFFGASKLNIETKDRFGRLVRSKEWFFVPVFIIDEMVEKIKDGTISDYYYDTDLAKLKKR